MNEQEFKALNRLDHCSGCSKRIPCGTFESICELISPCAVCEIKNSCTQMCSQIKAFLSRGSQGTEGRDITYSIGDMDNFFSYKNFEHNKESSRSRRIKYNVEDIPWGAISARDRTLTEDYFKHSKTLFQLSKEHKLTPGRISQILFGRKGGGRRKVTPTWGAVKTLRIFIKYRELYNKYGHYLLPTQRQIVYNYYFKYCTVKDISKGVKLSPANVYSKLTIARKKLNKYSKSVKKV